MNNAKGFLINPWAATVSEVTVDGDYKVIYGLLSPSAADCGERAPTVKLVIDGDQLRVTGKNYEAGTSAETVPCAAKVSKPKPTEWREERHFMEPSQPCGFNATCLIGALKALEGATVTIHGEDNASPFRLEGERDDRLIVLMPLRV